MLGSGGVTERGYSTGQLRAIQVRGESIQVERYSLSPAQRRLWTGQKREPDSPLYHMAFLFRLPDGIDRDTWCEAFWDVVEEADALRTVVVEEEGVPECRVSAPDRSPIDTVESLSDAAAWAETRARSPLQERLWDAAWLEMSDSSAAWYINLHHLITDAVSIVRVMERLHAHYRERAGLGADDEPPLPSYASVIGEMAEAPEDSAAFWKRVCADAVCRLPVFGKAAEPGSTRSRRRTVMLTPTQMERLAECVVRPAFRGFTPEAVVARAQELL